MADTPLDPRLLADACMANGSALAESLNRCFGISLDLVPGERTAWGVPPEALFAPGLLLRISTADSALVALIPSALPLPAWHSVPNDAEKTRLATLASDWAKLLLPTGTVVTSADALPVPDLASTAAAMAVAGSELIPLATSGAANPDTAQPRGTIYLLCPAATPAGRSDVESSAQPAAGARPLRLGRLMNLPVKVVVHLAERKIHMAQLLALSPGALITFDKDCEDLLDLYINNRLYGRGEAVKIGEHFGLKVNEVGSVKHRPERVF